MDSQNIYSCKNFSPKCINTYINTIHVLIQEVFNSIKEVFKSQAEKTKPPDLLKWKDMIPEVQLIEKVIHEI